MTGALIDIIDRLVQIDDTDRFDPPVIFAQGGANAAPDSRALVSAADDEDSRICPLDAALTEVLPVFLATEAIQVWSAWRDGRVPTREQKFEAVMYYSKHDSYLPVSVRVTGA